MKLSVIIPVYNAEAYLEKCVESVMAFPCEKEVILVEDGSKDHSSVICDEIRDGITELRKYGIKDSAEIKVIHQENKGVSAARNAGLDVATGDYVWFVDSDDLAICPIMDDGLWMMGLVPETKLVIFGFVWEENGEAKSFGASKYEIPYNLWRCWFNRKAIEDARLRFTVGRKYAEDQEFILQFLLNCNINSGITEIRNHGNTEVRKYGITEAINEPLYYYTLRLGSAMTKKGVKGKKICDVAAVLLKFFWQAILHGMIGQKWVWREIKRMTKSLYVTIVR